MEAISTASMRTTGQSADCYWNEKAPPSSGAFLLAVLKEKSAP
jgi:hypothetical protein